MSASRFCLAASLAVAASMNGACATSEDVPVDFDAGLYGVGTTGGVASYTGGYTSTGGIRTTGSATGAGGTSSTGGSLSGTGGTLSCASGQKLCGSNCVAPLPSNGCSGSCNPCPAAPANAQASCTGGQCDFTCNTGYSKSGQTCVIDPTCTDNQKNGSETDVDCGGASCPKCAPGKVCTGDADCAKGPCQSGICGCTAATCASANSCASALDDGCGNTLDCSQSCSMPAICYQSACCTPKAACPSTSCAPALSDGCGGTLDCSSNCASGDVCLSSLTCCTPKPCGTQCGHPGDGCGTTLDCGLCADGKACSSATDCVSGVCQSGTCVSCTDGVKNNGETAVDCGGSSCPKCANGSTCKVSSDCISNKCCGLFDFGSCWGKTGTCE